jgi:hypothetical protein
MPPPIVERLTTVSREVKGNLAERWNGARSGGAMEPVHAAAASWHSRGHVAGDRRYVGWRAEQTTLIFPLARSPGSPAPAPLTADASAPGSAPR